MVAHVLSCGVFVLMNRFNVKILLGVVGFVVFALLLLLRGAAQDLLNFVVFEGGVRFLSNAR